MKIFILLLLLCSPIFAQETNIRVGNGKDATQGATTDAAVSGDVNGTISAKTRQLNRILTAVWDSGTNKINVQFTNPISVTGTFWQATQPVSGTFFQATQPVSITAGNFPDNEPFNVAQINGVTPLMGNGVTGTGSHRVTLASDTTTNTNPFLARISQTTTDNDVDVLSVIPGTGATNLGKAEDALATDGATGNVILAIRRDALPSIAITTTDGDYSFIAVDSFGALYAVPSHPNRFSCMLQAVTVTTQCQAAPAAGLRNYITSVHLSNQAATVQTLDIIYGTGAACVTSPVAITHKFQFGTVATTTSPFDIAATFPTPLVTGVANAVCVRPSAATAFGVTITGFIAP